MLSDELVFVFSEDGVWWIAETLRWENTTTLNMERVEMGFHTCRH
jgi:hypothetical protein